MALTLIVFIQEIRKSQTGEGEFVNKIKRVNRLAMISLVHENAHQFGRGIHRDMSQ